MNDAIQDFINNHAGQSGLVDQLMKFAARDLIFLTVPLVLALWFWRASHDERARNQRAALLSVVAVGIAIVLATLASHLHYQPRPFVSDSSTRLLIGHSADNSFPSDHAIVCFAFATALTCWRRFLGSVVLVGALLVGVSRVYVGVHWPGDIAASAILGAIAGAASAALMPLAIRLQSSRLPLPPRHPRRVSVSDIAQRALVPLTPSRIRYTTPTHTTPHPHRREDDHGCHQRPHHLHQRHRRRRDDRHLGRQARPRPDAQGRRHHGRRHAGAGQDRRGSRRLRRHGPRARALRHPRRTAASPACPTPT